jgi:adenylate cyclase, class 2
MEIEVKIPLSDRKALEDRLQRDGFHVAVPRAWETNDIYDTDEQNLRHKGMLLRLRQTGTKAVITWKGVGEPGRHKSRPELETSIGSREVMAQILEQLGYGRTFRYEKYRTEYSDGKEHGVVTVDETPIGDYMEIEGPTDWIDATAARLGFHQKDYVLESYGQLYLDYCKRHGVEPDEMVFASH